MSEINVMADPVDERQHCVVEHSYGGGWKYLEGPMPKEEAEGRVRQLSWGDAALYRLREVTPEEARAFRIALAARSAKLSS